MNDAQFLAGELQRLMSWVGKLSVAPEHIQRVRLAFDHMLVAEALLRAAAPAR